MVSHRIVRPEQNIVIVGGSTGFGKAMAFSFLKRRYTHVGERHRILITGRDLMSLQKTRSELSMSEQADCRIHKMDARSWNDWADLSAVVQDFSPSIDHLVYCAGICEGPSPFLMTDATEYTRVLETNLIGAMHSLKFSRLPMLHVRHVYGVNGHGYDGSTTPEFAAYGCSKAGLNQLYNTVNREWIVEKSNSFSHVPGIHLISPGFMKTKLTEPIFQNIQSDDDITGSSYSNDNKKYVLFDGKKISKLQMAILKAIAASPHDVSSKIVPKMLKMKNNASGLTLKP